MVSAPVLLLPDFSKPFQLITDASTIAVAGILEQQDEDDRWRPVSFHSRKLHANEQMYSSYDLEALAVVDSVEHFRCYLEGRPFKLVTDHEALTYLQKQKHVRGRQARWVELLCHYSFDISYRPGRKNPADGLSRRPDYARQDQVSQLKHRMSLEELRALDARRLQALEGRGAPGYQAMCKVEELQQPAVVLQQPACGLQQPACELHQPATACIDLQQPACGLQQPAIVLQQPAEDLHQPAKVMYLGAMDISEVRDIIRAGYAGDAAYKRHLRGLKKEGDFWYRDGKLCIPSTPRTAAVKEEVIRQAHDDAGHFARDRTVELVQRLYYWPTLQRDVASYVKTCPACQRTKPGKESQQGLVQPMPLPSKPFESMSLDLIVGLPVSKAGNSAMVVFVDRFSKVAIVEPCTPQITAQELAVLYLQRVYSLFGLPKTLISDRDRKFIANFWEAVFSMLDVTLKRSTPYHPQLDGQTEITNKTLLSVLRKHAMSRPEDWNVYLPIAVSCMNNAVSRSTGMSAYQCLYGFHPRLLPEVFHELVTEVPAASSLMSDLLEVRKRVVAQLKKSQEYMLSQANKHRRHVEFAPGDLVLLSTSVLRNPRTLHHKLSQKFVGPFRVTHVPSAVNVVLDYPSHMRTHRRVHVEHIRRYHSDSYVRTLTGPPAPVLVDGEEEHKVAEILSRRVRRYGKGSRLEYLVSWEGYDSHENIWLPVQSLQNCQELIAEYDAQN